MGNSITSPSSTVQPNLHEKLAARVTNSPQPQPPPNNNNETSRVLFLLYLIHRTWNVVVESVDLKAKRSRLSGTTSEDSGAPRSYFDETSFCYYDDNDDDNDNDHDNDTDFDDQSSLYGSQYSFCSCSYCYESKQNAFYARTSGLRLSICESEISSFCIGYQMAPSICQNTPPSGKINTNFKMISDSNNWPQNFTNKENQRPPVYNPEDYVQSLKKFGKRQSCNNVKSIYDTSDNDKTQDVFRSNTLPLKHSEYKSPIQPAVELDTEMSLRQFGSITDLLTKLRADLRASFPSFVQEFVSSPLDGVSLLLDVLRAIQLSQTMNNNQPTSGTASIPRNSQSYQRRALLDELACLQCLSVCCCRSPEASTRLGTTPVGLLPLAVSATGQGIRSRILGLQLMTAACDKCSVGHGSQKSITAGHTAVSEALSTLRLRCSEPVRFRLMVGMLNSGGGSGELQAIGVKFLNTFLESSENLQSRLYLQAELYQAGLDPKNMSNTISSSSPWLEKLRTEIRRFENNKIDIEKLQIQARESERIRNQMVILERRVQILHEEKTVLTTMERRLQERCAELQREIFRLQGAHSENYKNLDKRPVALPRHVPPISKQSSSEHEDEGISSSETGPSLSPVPILVLPQKSPQKFSITLNGSSHKYEQTEEDATIEDVIEELENIVNDAEKEISHDGISIVCVPQKAKEQDIVPVNLLPQAPRKSRSLAHLVSHVGSDLDASDYGIMLINNQTRTTYFDDIEYETTDKQFGSEEIHIPPQIHTSTNRDILDVIMDARQSEDDPTMKAFRDSTTETLPTNLIMPTINAGTSSEVVTNSAPAHQFNGVFFMTGMNTPQKYPKPDLTAALQARRVTKNIERIESCGLQSLVDVVMTTEKSRTNQHIYFGSSPTLRINTGSNSFTNNITVMNSSIAKTRTRSYTQGSKVTDIPSGLY